MDKSQKEKLDMINSLSYNQILYLKIRLSSIPKKEVDDMIESMDLEKLKDFKELVKTINIRESDYIDKCAEDMNDSEHKKNR